jgi:hypothetical protein
MELIGHNDIRMTKHYTHVSGTRKKTCRATSRIITTGSDCAPPIYYLF